MNADWITLTLRIILVFLAGMTSHIAMKKHYVAISFFIFSVWFTFFRLTLLRVVSLYIGVFKHETSQFVSATHSVLISPEVSGAECLLVIFSLLFLLQWLQRQRRVV